MLIQFSVENFLSFDEEQVFSMAASTGDQMHPNHVVDGKGGPALRAAAIYGPNASGKSNLVQAISFARDLIVNGTERTQSVPVRPFKIRIGSQERPSKFEFHFRTKGILYNYGFRATSKRVEQEWLYATGIRNKEAMLFERSTTDVGKIELGVGPALAKGNRKKFFEFLAEGTRPNQLLLTEAVGRNVDELRYVAGWFTNVLSVIPADPRTQALAGLAHYYPKIREYLTHFLRSADTGIDTMETVETVLYSVDMIPDTHREKIVSLLDGLSDDELVDTNGPTYARDLSGRITQIDIKFRHKNSDSLFDFNEESDGTRRLVHLIPVIQQLEEPRLRVVIIDELDRSFHPHLSRLFVQAVLETLANESSNQLIFTTHDTNLLDLDLLRRDEIWFVEKDKGGASHMYSLAEFKVRPDLKIEKGYLNGRFGAIPFITPIDRLGWSDETTETSKESHPGQAAA